MYGGMQSIPFFSARFLGWIMYAPLNMSRFILSDSSKLLLFCKNVRIHKTLIMRKVKDAVNSDYTRRFSQVAGNCHPVMA